MKNRIILALVFLASAMVLTSCFDDDTTLATRPLSEISVVEGTIKTVYNLDINDTLTITPELTQSVKPLPIECSWEIGGEIFSVGQQLVYPAGTLGTFQCRLIAENEDGKTFFPFVINVNTSFEEGLAIVSSDRGGVSHLAFMLCHPDSVTSRFYDFDCFSKVNPEYKFASNVTDMTQSSQNLIIACQGSEKEDDKATIYYLNDKTFDLENMLQADPELIDAFKPLRIAMPKVSRSGGAYPIICNGGKVLDAASEQGAIALPEKLRYTYSPCFVNASTRNNASEWSLLFWDKELNGLAQIYKGYGPFYCSSGVYQLGPTDPRYAANNYFNDMEFKAMTRVRQTAKTLASGREELLVFVVSKATGMTAMVRLAAIFHTIDEEQKYTLQDNGGFVNCGMGNLCPFDENTPMLANNTYNTLFYANGNKVVSVNYRNMFVLSSLSTKYFVEIGSPEAVITDFEISADHQTTYVSFYEPSQSGKNGSVWTFNTQTGEIMDKYENICYQPVRMLYKEK